MSIFEQTMRLFGKTAEAAGKRAYSKSGKGPKGGKSAGPWGARPWSDKNVYVHGETTTVVLDRRTAENAYYALALALGGDRP
ncbi:MAG: hypothetical protein ACRD1T_00025 [Acidimicrobiia bacterium]